MDNNYWVDFWKGYTATVTEKDEQSQVLRTLNKQPISKELWDYTLKNIDDIFVVRKDERILDLCSGNGLLAKHFVSKGASVVAVDISEELLKNIADVEHIDPIQSDIRLVDFEANSFHNIILYAGIQYLNYKEAITLLKNIFKWLKPNGTVLIGDVPDLKKRWSFYNTAERQKVFFDNTLTDKAIVGTWFESQWFEHLTGYLGFSEGKLMPQDERLIYAGFRFDFVYKK